MRALPSNPVLPADATALDAVLGAPAAAPPPAPAPAAAPEPEPITTTTRKPGRTRERAPQQRIGTRRTPYERSDGTRVRQWALTLPVDVIQDMTICATKLDLKPAELVLELCRKYLARAKNGA